MIQELNQGTTLSDALGTGLGSGLAALAQQKLQQVQQRNQQQRVATGLEGIPGITPEQAQQLSNLDAPMLTQILGDIQKTQREREFMESQKSINPSQQGDAFSNITPRNQREAFEIAKERASHAEKKYQHILKENEPWKKTFVKKQEYATELDKPLTELEDLLHGRSNLKGPVASGLSAGGFAPTLFGNEATQRADMLINGIVAIEAQGFGGPVLTKAKQQLAASKKLSLTKQREVQLRAAQDLREEVDRIKKEGEIYNSIIQDNDGKQIPNMAEAIESRYKKLQHDEKRIAKEVFQYLPSPSSVEPGQIFDIPEAGIAVKSNGSEWEIVS